MPVALAGCWRSRPVRPAAGGGGRAPPAPRVAGLARPASWLATLAAKRRRNLSAAAPSGWRLARRSLDRRMPPEQRCPLLIEGGDQSARTRRHQHEATDAVDGFGQLVAHPIVVLPRRKQADEKDLMRHESLGIAFGQPRSHEACPRTRHQRSAKVAQASGEQIVPGQTDCSLCRRQRQGVTPRLRRLPGRLSALARLRTAHRANGSPP